MSYYLYEIVLTETFSFAGDRYAEYAPCHHDAQREAAEHQGTYAIYYLEEHGAIFLVEDGEHMVLLDETP
jgi:hypothetical protein